MWCDSELLDFARWFCMHLALLAFGTSLMWSFCQSNLASCSSPTRTLWSPGKFLLRPRYSLFSVPPQSVPASSSCHFAQTAFFLKSWGLLFCLPSWAPRSQHDPCQHTVLCLFCESQLPSWLNCIAWHWNTHWLIQYSYCLIFYSVGLPLPCIYSVYRTKPLDFFMVLTYNGGTININYIDLKASAGIDCKMTC